MTLQKYAFALLLGFILIFGILVHIATGQTTRADESDSLAIRTMLLSGDKAQQDIAIDEIHKAIKSDAPRAIKGMRKLWMKPLLHDEQYDVIAELSLECVLAAPKKVDDVTNLMQNRINALLKAGKPDQALSDAKSLYCVSTLKDSGTAMILVVNCLSALHPDDSTNADTFKDEQMRGAATTEPSPSTVLTAVKVNEKIFLDAIKNIQPANQQPNEGTINLLLLAGHGMEVRKFLEIRYAAASSDDLRYRAAIDIGRAIKAEDGVVGPANAWLKAHLPAQAKIN